MIQFGLHTNNPYLIYGNRENVCAICAAEKVKKDRENREPNAGLAKAKHDLAGQQSARPLFSVPTGSSEPTYICKKHMKQLVEEMEKMAEGEVVTDE